MYKPVPSRIDKKIPRGRKISYRESKGENNYLHHLEFQLTGQLSVQQNLKSNSRLKQIRLCAKDRWSQNTHFQGTWALRQEQE